MALYVSVVRHDGLLYVYNVKWSSHSYKFIFFWWWEKSCSFSAFTAINLPLSTAAFGSYLWVFSNFPRDFFVDPVVDSFSHYLWIFQSSFHLWLHAIVVAEDTGLFSVLRLVLWPNTWSAVENVHLRAWVECRVCCSRCFLVDLLSTCWAVTSQLLQNCSSPPFRFVCLFLNWSVVDLKRFVRPPVLRVFALCMGGSCLVHVYNCYIFLLNWLINT